MVEVKYRVSVLVLKSLGDRKREEKSGKRPRGS